MIHLEQVEIKEINNQKLFFFTNEDWEEIIVEKEFLGCVINAQLLKVLIKWNYPISKKCPEIFLAGAIENTKGRSQFMIYTLVKINNYFQRIEIRSIVCSSCNERILIGNPFVSDIYLGIPLQNNIQELMNNARQYELKKLCPECSSSTINQAAIWIKSESEIFKSNFT